MHHDYTAITLLLFTVLPRRRYSMLAIMSEKCHSKEKAFIDKSKMLELLGW